MFSSNLKLHEGFYFHIWTALCLAVSFDLLNIEGSMKSYCRKRVYFSLWKKAWHVAIFSEIRIFLTVDVQLIQEHLKPVYQNESEDWKY